MLEPLQFIQGTVSHSPLCPCYFLKKNPEPQKGLFSDIAALISNSPIRACRLLSPSVSEHTKHPREDKGKNSEEVTLPCDDHHRFWTAFIFQFQQLQEIYCRAVSTPPWWWGISSIWNPPSDYLDWIISVWRKLFSPLASTALKKKVHNSLWESEVLWARLALASAFPWPTWVDLSGSLRPLFCSQRGQRVNKTTPVPPWFVLIGHWLSIGTLAIILSFYPHGFSVLFCFSVETHSHKQ